MYVNFYVFQRNNECRREKKRKRIEKKERKRKKEISTLKFDIIANL